MLRFKMKDWFKDPYAFQVYVLKRPHVDEFLKRMGELFECVLFTASLAKVRNFCTVARCDLYKKCLLTKAIALQQRMIADEGVAYQTVSHFEYPEMHMKENH